MGVCMHVRVWVHAHVCMHVCEKERERSDENT